MSLSRLTAFCAPAVCLICEIQAQVEHNSCVAVAACHRESYRFSPKAINLCEPGSSRLVGRHANIQARVFGYSHMLAMHRRLYCAYRFCRGRQAHDTFETTGPSEPTVPSRHDACVCSPEVAASGKSGLQPAHVTAVGRSGAIGQYCMSMWSQEDIKCKCLDPAKTCNIVHTLSESRDIEASIIVKPLASKFFQSKSKNHRGSKADEHAASQ